MGLGRGSGSRDRLELKRPERQQLRHLTPPLTHPRLTAPSPSPQSVHLDMERLKAGLEAAVAAVAAEDGDAKGQAAADAALFGGSITRGEASMQLVPSDVATLRDSK